MFVEKRLARDLDFQFIIAVLALITVGFFTIYSATHANRALTGGDSLYSVKKQATGLAAGVFGAYILASYDYRQLMKAHKWLYALGILLLLSVLLFGHEVNGSKSWIPLGAFSFQPSEAAKILFCLSLARYLSTRADMSSWSALLGAFMHIGIPLGLIMLQPDLGTGLVLVAMLFAMLYMSGVPAKRLLAILLVAACLSPLAFMYGLKTYQQQRLLIFLDPYQDPMGAGYNVIQSTIAIGSGRLFGKGFMAGSQAQLNFLPAHHTDFIFSVIGEEWGFLGSIVVLALFFTVVWRGLRTAAESSDPYGTLVGTGLTTMFLFHVLINIGMTCSAMPVTGIPLPFLSYGGTSLMTNLTAVGILLSIQTRRQRQLF